MLTLTSIAALIGGFAHYAWVLLLLLVPQILDIVKPILESVVKGVAGFVSTVWEGANKATWATWCLVFTVAAITFAIGYHYGWTGAIDWGHEHYRWIAKKAVKAAWWKFW